MSKIHPTAIIESGAVLGDDVEVGAYAYIGGSVKIGKGTIIAHHATVDGNTVIGEYNQIFPYAYIGGKTHDLKYRGGNPGLIIGDRNVFREYTTAHLATRDGEYTVIGNDNNILAYSHIAHVVLEDYVVIGWGSGAHQFCRIGEYAMLSASSKLVKDLPPFLMADGSPAEVCAINKINMQRNGFSSEEIDIAYSAFKLIYKRRLSRTNAVEELSRKDYSQSRVAQSIICFMHGESERGIA